MFAPQATTTPPKICLSIPRPLDFHGKFSSSIIYPTEHQFYSATQIWSCQQSDSEKSTQASPHPSTKSSGERLQETYMVAAVAGEGEEVDLVAVANAAVLPKVGELRRAHPAEPRRAPRPASGEPRRTAPPRRRCERESLPRRHRRSGREGRELEKGGARSSNGRGTKPNKHNALTGGCFL
jgi:hypothetical protein